MAIGIQNLPNIVPPDASFPNGRIRDNDGTGNGTPVEQLSCDDQFQFFAKLLRRAGINPNVFPESEYYGHQYHDALNAIILAVVGKAISWTNIPLANGWIAGAQTPQWRKNNFGAVEFRGQLNGTGASSDDITATGVFPNAGYNVQMPSARVHVSTLVTDAIFISVQTSGKILSTDHANSLTLSLDTLSYFI